MIQDLTINKDQYPGVDIAKIIAIIFVITQHVIFNGLDFNGEGLVVSGLRSFIGSISASCIDIFALATGFLCVRSNFRYSRIIGLWLCAVFWGGVMLLFCSLLGVHVSFRDCFNAVTPVLNTQYWFFTSYFLLFFCMPMINKGVVSLSVKEYHCLLCSFFLFVCCYNLTGLGSCDRFHVNQGYSFTWLAMVYIFGAYIRLHLRKRINVVCGVIMAMLLVLCSMLPTYGRKILLELARISLPGFLHHAISYDSPFTLSLAILIFISCLKIRVERACVLRVLRIVASSAFGMYLIHVQPCFWRNIFVARLHDFHVHTVVQLIVYVPIFIGIVFLSLFFLELTRRGLFNFLGIDNAIKRLDKLLN